MISFFNKLTNLFRHNITRKEQTALKEIRNWDTQTIRIQDKGSSFITFDNSDYQEKVNQTTRSSFQKISENLTKFMKKKHLDRKMVQQKKALAKNKRNL